MLVNGWHWEKPGVRTALLNVAVVFDGKEINGLRLPKKTNEDSEWKFSGLFLFFWFLYYALINDKST